MLCIIDGDTLYLFMKNTCIGDSRASCHITNNGTGLFNIIDINELIQGSSRDMPATKKGSFMSTYDKFMVLNISIPCGL